MFVTNLHSTHDYKLLALGLVLLFIETVKVKSESKKKQEKAEGDLEI